MLKGFIKLNFISYFKSKFDFTLIMKDFSFGNYLIIIKRDFIVYQIIKTEFMMISQIIKIVDWAANLIVKVDFINFNLHFMYYLFIQIS